MYQTFLLSFIEIPSVELEPWAQVA